mmetsp:Transcript_27033/g.42217  ORF Transcript_27033/g.42217 Transcript_27033/m.42217 type:complete len:85 (+) Transcript_27033:637-891(+)
MGWDPLSPDLSLLHTRTSGCPFGAQGVDLGVDLHLKLFIVILKPSEHWAAGPGDKRAGGGLPCCLPVTSQPRVRLVGSRPEGLG